MAVAGQRQRGERQGDDHADDAHQCAPEAEAEQDSRRTESRDLTHDFRGEEHILESLHDDEHDRHEK